MLFSPTNTFRPGARRTSKSRKLRKFRTCTFDKNTDSLLGHGTPTQQGMSNGKG